MFKKNLLIASLILVIAKMAIGQDKINYPVNILYIEGSIFQTENNSFTLLDGSKWSKVSYVYLLPISDIYIIITDDNGNGIATSNGYEFNVKYLGGSLNYKKGKLNLVTVSMGNGAILKMADNTLWEIDSYDQYDTGYWLPPYNVIITNNELYLINFKKSKKIWASKVN